MADYQDAQLASHDSKIVVLQVHNRVVERTREGEDFGGLTMGLLCRFLVRGGGERECCLDPTGSELHAWPQKNLPVTIRTAGQDDRGIQPKGYCGSFVTVKVRSRSFSKGFVWARLPQDDGTWRGRLTKNNQTTQHPFIVPCEDTFGHCTPMYPRMICS